MSQVQCHLHNLEHVQVQVVLTAPENLQFNLLIYRLVTILDEFDSSVVCKLEEFNSWSLEVQSVVCREMGSGDTPGGAKVLTVSIPDMTSPRLTCCFLHVRKLKD